MSLDGVDRHTALDNSECPDCGSNNGYWQRGAVADFDYVCDDCRGIFDGTSTDRRADQ